MVLKTDSTDKHLAESQTENPVLNFFYLSREFLLQPDREIEMHSASRQPRKVPELFQSGMHPCRQCNVAITFYRTVIRQFQVNDNFCEKEETSGVLLSNKLFFPIQPVLNVSPMRAPSPGWINKHTPSTWPICPAVFFTAFSVCLNYKW